MTTTILTEAAKKRVLKNHRLRMALFTRWEIVSLESLQRWCKLNDARLVHPDTIALICNYEKMDPENLTENVELQKQAE